MAEAILILGKSNRGKSASLRNMPPEETFIINCDEKHLPFQNGKKIFPSQQNPDKWIGMNHVFENDLPTIITKIKSLKLIKHVKYIVIDTLTFAMIETMMKQKGRDDWKKYLDFASEFYDLVKSKKSLRDDQFLIIMAHTELEDGTEQFKVPAGKFTREKLAPEGNFRTVLFTDYFVFDDDSREYYFWTQPAWDNTCRSPMNMFKTTRIPNDLKYVIDCTVAYDNGEDIPEPPEKLKVVDTTIVVTDIKKKKNKDF